MKGYWNWLTSINTTSLWYGIFCAVNTQLFWWINSMQTATTFVALCSIEKISNIAQHTWTYWRVSQLRPPNTNYDVKVSSVVGAAVVEKICHWYSFPSKTQMRKNIVHKNIHRLHTWVSVFPRQRSTQLVLSSFKTQFSLRSVVTYTTAAALHASTRYTSFGPKHTEKRAWQPQERCRKLWRGKYNKTADSDRRREWVPLSNFWWVEEISGTLKFWLS